MITRSLVRPLANAATAQWTCASCSAGIISQIQKFPAPQRRTIFSRPALNYDEEFEEEGIRGLFSTTGYRLGWIQYQDMMCKRLNELIQDDNALANKDVKDLAIRLARNPATASSFNHASMAHNNHFFYQQFAPRPRQLSQFPELQASLVSQFGSVETLKKTFIDTASAMFGPGFVWLVWARDPEYAASQGKGSWRILCTYNAGTPYPEAGFMQQSLDMNTNNAQSFYRHEQALGFSGLYSNMTRDRAKIPPGGTTLMPVLCASTWQHTYIYDHGLPNKNLYLNALWAVIDWQVVSNRTPSEVTNTGYR